MKMEFEWEQVDSNPHGLPDSYEETLRAQVFGGWLVRYRSYDIDKPDCHVSWFVADPDHEWEIIE